MPIYEYRCLQCGSRSEELIKSPLVPPACDPCRICGGERVKVISQFAYHRSDNERLAELDAGRTDSRSLRDDRNVGRWAKKRLMEIGISDATPQVERIAEAARQTVREAFAD